jgi:hypothetical protein
MAETEKVNWIEKRAQCSLAAVFEKLKLDVEGDVASRTAQLSTPSSYGFKVVSNHVSFSVVTLWNDPRRRSVTFTRSAQEIVAADQDGKVIVSAGITLDENGECRARVGGKEMEFWRLRQLALEDLLFGLEPQL